MNGRASKEGFLIMNPKYKHQKIQAMIICNAKALTFIQILKTLGKQHTEIRSDKKLSLICSLLTQNWIFNQLGTAKYGSDKLTKLLKSSWQGQKLAALIQKFL